MTKRLRTFNPLLSFFEEKNGEPQGKKDVLEKLGDMKKLVGKYDGEPYSFVSSLQEIAESFSLSPLSRR